MDQSRALALAALVLALAAPSGVRGQLASGHPGAAFGVSLPTGQLSDGHGSGFHLAGFMEYSAPTELMGLRAELFYQRFEPRQGLAAGASQAVGLIANAVYHIPGRAYHPYLIGGMGAYRVTDESTRLGFNMGAGFEIPLTGISARFEARIHKVLTDRSSYLALPISFALSF